MYYTLVFCFLPNFWTEGHPESIHLRQAGFPKFPFEYKDSPPISTCGKRKIHHSPPINGKTPRIVGGESAPRGAYPWMAHVESLTFEGFKHSCGGTVVSEYFIVTAAHCIHGYREREVRIKVGDYDSEHRDPTEKIYEVEGWRVHPNFQKDGIYDNDIAIIKIKPSRGQGIEFSRFVSTACLPTESTSYPPGTTCYISGWGLTHPDNFYPSRSLKAASVAIISDSVCRRPGVLGPRRLKPGMLCAGYLKGGIDSCNGDSGGPLVCEIEGEFTLLGVVSWGVDCAKENKPGVYSNVKYYLDFIKTAMEQL